MKKAVWLIFAICFSILFLLFGHADMYSIITYEVNFWNAIVDRGITGFYDYCYEINLAGGASIACYDFIVYIVLGIWGLPLFGLTKMTGINPWDNLLMTFYGKAIYLVALAMASYYFYKICIKYQLSKKEAEQAVFAFVSSALILIAVCLVGQSDILGIAVVLIAYYYYLDDARWRALLFFALAFGFKSYALVVFVPLLLLKEKNVFKILSNLFIIVLPTMILNLPFSGVGFEAKSHFQLGMISELLRYRIPILNGNVPVLVLLYGILCVICYLYKDDGDSTGVNRWSLIVAFVSMVILFASFKSTVYWLVWIAPWAVLCVFICADDRRLAFLFETIGMLCLSVAYVVKAAETGYCLPSSRWLAAFGFDCSRATEIYQGLISSVDASTEHRLDWILGCGEALYLACVSGILILCIRNMWVKKKSQYKMNIIGGEQIGTIDLIGRFTLNMACAFIPLLFILILG